MVNSDLTFLGYVRKVIGSKLSVAVSKDIPSANPIVHGRIYRLGQIGSFVRIPMGFFNVYGVVSMVGASEFVLQNHEEVNLPPGQRWLEVQLIGESYANEEFKRGVSVFPTIDDEVHIVTEDDLRIIHGTSGESMIEIGTHAASESLTASIDLDKLVTRHAAIIGSTGSGKSNTVAGFLKQLSYRVFPNARIVVIDPHSEYSSALQTQAEVFSINSDTHPLILPFWALAFDELGWLLVDRRSASESQQDIVLRDKIFQQKQEICDRLKAGSVNKNEITADSPIPFNLKELWYNQYLLEHATLNIKDDWDSIAFKKDESGNEKRGSVGEVIPPEFEPPATSNNPPYRSIKGSGLATYLNKIFGRLKDKRYNFLLNPGTYNGFYKDLDDLIISWVDHKKPVTVFDLGGVPPEITDIVVGVLTRILFESMFWGRDLSGMGRQRPLLIVYEEAHSYLPRGGSSRFILGFAGKEVSRVFKEGRKYGVGAIVISQRPSELDETILSQCGTFFALRLSNSEDQGRVRSMIPDTLEGLVNLLPALRTGEALVLGEAVKIPSRIRLPLIEPRPKSDDPEPAKRWKVPRTIEPPYAKAITCWRRQQLPNLNEEGVSSGERTSSIE